MVTGLQSIKVYLEKILTSHRGEIIEKWIRLLHSEVSERYRKRPEEELFVTVSAACDADYAVLINNDYSKIGEHIEWITKVRIEGGFSLRGAECVRALQNRPRTCSCGGTQGQKTP